MISTCLYAWLMIKFKRGYVTSHDKKKHTIWELVGKYGMKQKLRLPAYNNQT